MEKKLVALEQPFFHLIIGQRSKFYDKAWPWYSYEGPPKVVSRIIRGWKSTNYDSFFNEFAAVFQFPDYFGENWAAFDDCLEDLAWLPAEAYILFISDIDKVLQEESQEDFNIFIRHLIFAVKEWTQGRNYDSFPTPPTPFHVVFHCTEEKLSYVKQRLDGAKLHGLNFIFLEEESILSTSRL